VPLGGSVARSVSRSFQALPLGSEPDPFVDGRAEAELDEVFVEHAAVLDVGTPALEAEPATELVGVGVRVEVLDPVLGELRAGVGLVHVRVDDVVIGEELLEDDGVGLDERGDALGGLPELLVVEAEVPERTLCSLVEVHSRRLQRVPQRTYCPGASQREVERAVAPVDRHGASRTHLGRDADGSAMSEPDPVDRASGGEDIYEVTGWEPRSVLDRIAVRLHAGVLAGSKWLVVLSAVFVTVAIFGASGFDLVLEPVVTWLVVTSVLPALALAAYLRYVDVTTDEPLGLLAITFLLAVVVAGFAAVINSVALVGLGGVADAFGNVVALAIFFYLVVGPVEESVKLLAVRLYAYPDERFDAVIDGAVYGAVAGLGFATIENAIYITDLIQSEGGLAASTQGQLGGITASRAIAGPGHVLYSAIAGYYLGLAKFTPDRAGPIVAKGLIVAALFHATYNFTVGPGSNALATAFPLSGFGGVFVYVIGFQSIVGYYLYRKLRRYRDAYEEHDAGRRRVDLSPELTEFDP